MNLMKISLLGLMLIGQQVISAETQIAQIPKPQKLSLKLSSWEQAYTTEFSSSINKHNYQIFVRLPTEIEPGKKYPTVYLLDGDITFPLISTYQRYLEFSEEVPKVIIVGIAYGTDDWRKGNMRGTDYTAPSEAAAHYGGAESFTQVIAKELIPYVEQHFPSDQDKRIIFGQSLGGQFVLFNKFRPASAFWGGIASNPAIHNNTDLFIQKAGQPMSKMSLAIVHADQDAERFKEPRQALLSVLEKMDGVKGIHVHEAVDHNHFSLAPVAYRQGMKLLFKVK